jgi:hypothetical protein
MWLSIVWIQWNFSAVLADLAVIKRDGPVASVAPEWFGHVDAFAFSAAMSLSGHRIEWNPAKLETVLIFSLLPLNRLVTIPTSCGHFLRRHPPQRPAMTAFKSVQHGPHNFLCRLIVGALQFKPPFGSLCYANVYKFSRVVVIIVVVFLFRRSR